MSRCGLRHVYGCRVPLNTSYFVRARELDTLLKGDIRGGLYELRAQLIALGVILISALLYVLGKAVQKSKGINVEYAFKEIPPE